MTPSTAYTIGNKQELLLSLESNILLTIASKMWSMEIMEMSRKLLSKPTDPLAGVYVIPDPKIYDKKKMKGDPTWEDVFGKAKCARCGQKMKPGEEYTARSVRGKHENWRLEATHFEPCEPAPKKRRGQKQ